MGDDIQGMCAAVHRAALPDISYAIIIKYANVNEHRVTYNVKKGVSSPFFIALMHYWIELNFRSYPAYEEVLRKAKTQRMGEEQDAEKCKKIKTILQKVWQAHVFNECEYVIIIAEFDQDPIFLESVTSCDRSEVMPAVLKGIEIAKGKLT